MYRAHNRIGGSGLHLPFLIVHITAGIIGLISGTFAMSFRKGSQGHRRAGNVFVVSMLIMGACASYLAVFKHQMNNFFGGLLTFYMVTTAWLAGRQGSKDPGAFDWIAMAMGFAIGASVLTLGIRVATGQSEGQPGVPIGMYFFLASISLLAAAGDVRLLIRGGFSGKPRLVRHLWRMCFGLFIATGSFFLGQQQVFPNALRKQYLLAPLAILPLALLMYWMLRVSLAKRILSSFMFRGEERT
jgi:Predicted membrane protein (DUF2306)